LSSFRTMERDSMRTQSRGRDAVIGLLVLAGLLLCAPATAEVRVTQSASDALMVEAHDATLREVFDALGAVRQIEYRVTPELSQPVNGTYAGTLPRILSRLLDGHDYVIQWTASGLRIDIVSAGPRATVASASAATPTTATVSPPGVVAPNIGNRVSTNVDLDEENLAKMAGQGTNTALAGAPWSRPGPPVLSENSSHPHAAQTMHGFMDLDGELTQ